MQSLRPLRHGPLHRLKNVSDFSPGGLGAAILKSSTPGGLGTARLMTSSSAKTDKPLPQDDLQLAYSSYERGDYVSSKSPILLLHCLLGRKENWSTVGQALNRLTQRKIVIPDARNHGDSPSSTDMSHKAMSGDVVRLMANLDIKKASLVGHGLGGRHAMYTALMQPDLVDKLILVSSSPINNQASQDLFEDIRQACYVVQTLAKSLGGQGDVLTSLDFKMEADKALKSVLPDTKVRALLISNLARINRTAILANPGLWKFPTINKTFDKPVLFISGENAPSWANEQEVRSIQNLFPNANFVKIANSASAFPQMDNQEQFLEATATFLQHNHKKESSVQ